ncbi:outer membrane efflux protein [bacterium BMS3Abin11]|nr:outer membrane efflux protein [bacterium BMS3Abin11]HDH08725.1 TolC family protein [Gammaproteobacteria bacterium]HDZ78514.1 TolC family protein [Gammaproteobacteria bacterium]
MINKTLLVSALCAGLLAVPTWANQTKPAVSLDNYAPADLTTLISDTLPDHPRLLAARDALQAAITRLQAAGRPLYNPELEFDTENTDINTTVLQYSQKIDSGGQRKARTGVAEAELKAARAEFELAELSLLHDLLTALSDQQSGKEIAALAVEGLELMREFADIAKRRYQAGDLSQVETNLAQLAYNEAMMAHAQALTAYTVARERVIALFPTPPAKTSVLPESLPSPVLPADIEAFVIELPTIRKSASNIGALSERVALRNSERSWEPTLAVRGGRENDKSLVGLTLSLPLKIRNDQKAEVQTARQELAQAEQILRQTERDLKARVLSSTQRYRLLRSAFDAWRKSGRGHIDSQLALTKRLWRSGDMSTTDYLVQLKQALDTQASGIELRNQMWRSSFEWMKDTAIIDDWLKITNTGIDK